MKNIGIYLERKPESGGAYQYCLSMLKALSELQNEINIVAFCTYPEWKQITEKLNIQTVLVQKNLIEKLIYFFSEHFLPVIFYRRFLQKLHPLARSLKRNKMDCCIYPCGDKISFMINLPAVVTVFDLMHRYLSDFPEITEKRIYKNRERSNRNITLFAQAIFVDSEVGKQQMIESYGVNAKLKCKLETTIKVLPMIAPDYIYLADKSKEYKSKVPFKKYIFYPAQLWKHKNHKNLLLAIEELKKENVYINLVICGSGKNAGDEVDSIINKHQLYNQVIILGYVTNEEMIALYRNARALVMPTFGGPTNIPQLEAFVLGCPVATSDVFGIPEQVNDAALLFDPNNIQQIKECVKILWESDTICKDLILKGYKQAEDYGEKQYKELLKTYLIGL